MAKQGLPLFWMELIGRNSSISGESYIDRVNNGT